MRSEGQTTYGYYEFVVGKDKECWGEGFLSWNREKEDDYEGEFATQFKAKAEEKGIHVIIDADFNPHHSRYMFNNNNNNPDRFSSLYPISFVLFSEDYVASEKCMLQLLAMEKSNMTPHPINVYTEAEIGQKQAPYFRWNRYLEIAYKIFKDERDQDTIFHLFSEYIYGDKSSNQPLSPDLPFQYMSLTRHWFPDYDTFYALDSCAKKAFNIITTQGGIGGDDGIMYLGIIGSTDKYNQFVAQNVVSPHRLPSNALVVKHIDMLDKIECAVRGPPPGIQSYEDLFDWGLEFAEYILHFSATQYYDYSLLIDNLPTEKCFLLIENVPCYNMLKALANVFDFLRPGSRIVFTTTNDDLFSQKSWHMYPTSNDAVPTLAWFQGQMLDDEELANLKKCVMVTKHEPPTHEGSFAQKKLRIVEQEPLSSS